MNKVTRLFLLIIGEQQKIKDLWQQQQDQLQQQYDRVREEEEQQRRVLEQLRDEHPYNLITGNFSIEESDTQWILEIIKLEIHLLNSLSCIRFRLQCQYISTQ